MEVKDFRVKIVAIAKDEAAYLPEWCAHHLYFGFDEIEIFVNRTSDNTLDVLGFLSEKDNRIKFQCCDWVDTLPLPARKNFQTIIYAKAFFDAKSDFSHVMFIDVDEYWTSSNLDKSIHDSIIQAGCPHVISYPWRNVLEDSEFSEFPKCYLYEKSSLVKSILSTSAPVESMFIHRPLLDEDHKDYYDGSECFPDGTPFVKPVNAHQRMHPNKKESYFPCFILHRINKSQLEYLSRVVRGQAEGYSIAFNRSGFNRVVGEEGSHSFPEDRYSKYLEFVHEFLGGDKRYLVLLDAARSYVRKRASDAFGILKSHIEDHPEDILKVTYGLDSPDIKELRRLCQRGEGG